MLHKLWRFFFPPDQWASCEPPSEAQRLAQWELRLGQHRAAERLRAERVQRVMDMRATVRVKYNPNLPA